MTLPNPSKGDGYRAIMPYFHTYVFDKKFYEGTSEKGYEIRIFDINGGILRKIRKDYSSVPIGPEDRQQILKLFERMPEQIKKTIYFPDNFPPFQRMFFLDEEGRLFVMTYEKGQNPREYIFDIFNPDGIYIARIGLDNFGQVGARYLPFPIMSRNDYLYHIRENDNGFKELVVHKMIWH